MRLENFHTHTKRCGHAKGSDIEYVQQAIDQGFATLGFSDHTPWPDTEKLAGDNSRMRLEELSDYVASVNSLREQFSGKIDIRLGLECEPFKDYFGWLEDTKGQFDIEYLIIGNHYVTSKADEIFVGKTFDTKDTSKYMKNLQYAMESGLFRYAAHPDLLFSNYKVEDDYVKSVSRDICQLSLDTGVALEYNLSGFLKRKKHLYDGLGFPCECFWNIAATYNVDTYIGFDAHAPERIQRDEFIESAQKLISMGLKVKNYSEN